ncbi:MAG: acetylxylan esterase [Acidobacteriota bacterium]|nr:acetylxylan esterase [Acidobacteriota bacterium]
MTTKLFIRRLAIALMVALLGLSASLAQTQQPQFVPNYDESKVGDYKLPDPLVMANGARVTTARQWRERRQEILRLYETHVYGRTPAAAKAAKIRVVETSRDAKALGGLATRKEVTVYLAGKQDGPKMSVLVYIPNQRTQPAPVFVGLNFNGNQAIHNDPGISLASSWLRDGKETGAVNNRATEKSRGTEASRWPVEMIVKRGYAVATIYNGDLFPDHKDGLKESVIPHFYRNGQTSPDADEWNALGAWAWGLSRAVDAIEKDKDLDAKRIALLGHSRLGKGALWAGAQDERFALVISNESGEGGAALARRNFGETVERINTAFPHWFNANFKKYNKDVASLPVDQHMLLALMAPRPLYVASAVEDQWADPRGEFLSAQAADPVYRLLKTDGLGATELPGLHQPVTTTIGHHIRAGKHDVTNYDWEQFMNFADKHLRAKR